MPTPDLTPRQREVLGLIRAMIGEKGYPPTVREIGERLGVKSPHAVHYHLRELERKGYVKRSGAARRTLTIVGDAEEPNKTIPFKGKVS